MSEFTKLSGRTYCSGIKLIIFKLVYLIFLRCEVLKVAGMNMVVFWTPATKLSALLHKQPV
jgi:hypothetical protein